MSILRARDLEPAELTDLLTALRFPEGLTARAWLDGLDGWSLDYWRGVDGKVLWYSASSRHSPEEKPVRDLLPRLAGGRIFAPAGELRWRLLPALGERCCRTVYLGDDLAAVAGLAARTELEGVAPLPQKDEYPLWGLLTDATRGVGSAPDEWVELRVPHRFRYPVDTAGLTADRVAVKAIVETWVDACGEAHFVRLCDLQAYAGERVMPRGESFWNPYRWVPAAKKPVQRERPLYHHRWQGLAGRLHCTLEALTPFLINDGMGAFIRSRRTQAPFIPATSLKGQSAPWPNLLATPPCRSRA
jgi:hypothetical protein